MGGTHCPNDRSGVNDAFSWSAEEENGWKMSLQNSKTIPDTFSVPTPLKTPPCMPGENRLRSGTSGLVKWELKLVRQKIFAVDFGIHFAIAWPKRQRRSFAKHHCLRRTARIDQEFITGTGFMTGTGLLSAQIWECDATLNRQSRRRTEFLTRLLPR
jgi:hypothetical protein